MAMRYFLMWRVSDITSNVIYILFRCKVLNRSLRSGFVDNSEYTKGHVGKGWFILFSGSRYIPRMLIGNIYGNRPLLLTTGSALFSFVEHFFYLVDMTFPDIWLTWDKSKGESMILLVQYHLVLAVECA